MSNEHPLIIAFYLDRDMLTQPQLIQPFVESVDHMIETKKLNMVTFFLPCADGESERVECLNPVIMQPAELDRITKLIDDIEKNFSIGADIEIPEDQNIEILGEPCTCGSNPNGQCKC